MRKLVITQNMTLDRRVEMLDDWFDPQLADDDLMEGATAVSRRHVRSLQLLGEPRSFSSGIVLLQYRARA